MSLTSKNITLNLFYYAATIVILPWGLLSLEADGGLFRQPSPGFRTVSIFLGLVGATLQLWCIVLFQRIGGGTPSPALPPERLVTMGPYRWVRNPMNIGELMLLFALAGWFASLALFAYALVAWLAFHSFIVLREEPKHLERFGEEYVQYKARVNRWIPRLRGIPMELFRK